MPRTVISFSHLYGVDRNLPTAIEPASSVPGKRYFGGTHDNQRLDSCHARAVHLDIEQGLGSCGEEFWAGYMRSILHTSSKTGANCTAEKKISKSRQMMVT